GGGVEGLGNVGRPLVGAAQVAALVAASARRARLHAEPRELNGQAALVFYRGAEPFAALTLAVAEGRIQRVFFHADATRLRHLGSPPDPPATSTDVQAR